MIKVGLHNAEIVCILGCLEEERTHKQKIFVDCEYELECCKEDDLALTCDYRVIFEVFKRVADREYLLLESLADAMAKEVLDTFPAICSIFLRVKKPQPFLECEYSFVEVKRERTA